MDAAADAAAQPGSWTEAPASLVGSSNRWRHGYATSLVQRAEDVHALQPLRVTAKSASLRRVRSRRRQQLSSPVVRYPPTELPVRILGLVKPLSKFRHGVLRSVIGMTPLVPEPVIVRVVRLIERVEQGLEPSDGGSLWEITCHAERDYRRNTATSRAEVGLKSSADSSLHHEPVPGLLMKSPSEFG